MTLSLDQLKNAFKSQDSQENRSGNYYPFWSMKVGEQTTIRFVPDANNSNPLGFMVEKLMHNLVVNGEKENVPCLKMYGENDCPICKVSAAFYKADDKAQGKKYWRKKQHLCQALIVEDPLPKDAETGETHEGKVRVIALGFQLFNIIKESFESGELDNIPYAYEDGCNFVIKKTKQGEYDTYAVGSKFARKTSTLTEDVIAGFEDDLVDLQTLLPAHPTYDKVEMLLESDITGATYQSPSTDQEPTIKPATATPATTPATPATESTKPVEATKPADGGEEYDAEAADILSRIRNRRENG